MMFILLLIPYVINAKSNFINIGKTYDGQFNFKTNHSLGHSYYFEISELLNNADIIIIVSQQTPQGDPNIFLSLLNPEPYSIEQSELGYCQSQGSDLCVIDKKHIQIDKPYYIGITCSEDCKYTLKVNYDQEQIMLMNDLLRFKMNERTSSQIVRIQIDHTLNIEELEITGRIINYFEIENPFHMYLNLGDILPTSQESDYVGKDFWHGHKYLILPWIQIQNSSILTIIVESQIGSLIELQTQTYEKIRKSVYESMIQGEVKLNQFHHYQIDKQQNQNPQNYLQIQLKPYSGLLTVYFNFEQELPQSLEDFEYKYIINQTSIITFSDMDLIKYDKIESIDIIIYGNELSSYQFKVSPQNNLGILSQNVNYQGRVYKDKLLSFLLDARNDIMSGKLNLQMESENNNVVIIIKKSMFQQEIITNDNIKNMDKLESENPSSLFIFTKKDKQNLLFELDFPIISQNVQIGLYSIGIFLNESNTYFSTYSFILKSELQFKRLKDNTPYKSVITKESYSYFQYVLNPIEYLEEIQIMLTSIQGTSILLSSTKDYPNETHYEQIGENNLITYYFKETLQNNQVYFISVYCQTAGIFTITVIIKNNNNNQEKLGAYPWEYTQIFQGDSQYHVLNNQTVGLFKIDLTEQLEIKQRQFYGLNKKKKLISIHILSPLGGIMMYGFVSPSTNSNNSIWSNPKEISVKLNQLNGEQTVFLRIELQEHYNYSTYKIALHSQFQSTNHIQEIIENEHYFGYIDQKGQLLLFRYYQKYDYSIIKNSEDKENDVRVTVFLRKEDLSSQESTLLIPKEKLEDIECRKEDQELNYCSFLIQITAKKPSFYTLIISHENNQISLHMDQIIHHKLPKENDHYYSFIDERDSNIIVRNLNQNVQLQILVTLFQPQNIQTNIEYPYPLNETQSNLLKISKNFKGFHISSVSIFKDDIAKTYNCSTRCMIAITIRQIPNFNYIIDSNSVYSIIYSSGSRQLSLKSFLPGKISKGYTAYYSVQITEEDVELIIFLEDSNLCNATIIISKDEFPNEEKHDWVYNHLDQKNISISNYNNNIYENMKGYYYIGVLGESECNYYITYYLNDPKEKQLQEQLQDDNFQIPYLLIQNQQQTINSINPILWKFECQTFGRLLIQLQYLPYNINIIGLYDTEKYNQNYIPIEIIFKNDLQLIGYFTIQKLGFYYLQTSIENSIIDIVSEPIYQIRVALIREDSILPDFQCLTKNLISEIIQSDDKIIINVNPLRIELMNSSFQIEQIKYVLLFGDSNSNNKSVYFHNIDNIDNVKQQKRQIQQFNTRTTKIVSKRYLDTNLSFICQDIQYINTTYSIHAIATFTLYNLERIEIDYFYDQKFVMINQSIGYQFIFGIIVLIIIIIVILLIIFRKWQERRKVSLVKNVQQNSIEMIFKNIDQ
ncbi:unnamed protein product [Paramecium primaurelia]|uniref:Transmembrane protein n=1 Tax=Paramecium primaurelia TaxID=5886 RepID=A0A8S1NXT4_PARPR|nr:unnamed protein product [Paramecium primaurelia]